MHTAGRCGRFLVKRLRLTVTVCDQRQERLAELIRPRQMRESSTRLYWQVLASESLFIVPGAESDQVDANMAQSMRIARMCTVDPALSLSPCSLYNTAPLSSLVFPVSFNDQTSWY